MADNVFSTSVRFAHFLLNDSIELPVIQVFPIPQRHYEYSPPVGMTYHNRLLVIADTFVLCLDPLLNELQFYGVRYYVISWGEWLQNKKPQDYYTLIRPRELLDFSLSVLIFSALMRLIFLLRKHLFVYLKEGEQYFIIKLRC
ncbi:hypothetical protein WCT78_06675 [Pectobacterium versatile]|uniref:hypothetical protein n=1 Tax=Pectobacterium versatile TaxID=2488639 RepID=UPI001F4648AC|nr:hypothetical protein [Pectobacterium versatile]GKV80737.1 hypothetical protein PEC106664_15110 [Pectobacterium carotovorum subsp. carotovorum]